MKRTVKTLRNVNVFREEVQIFRRSSCSSLTAGTKYNGIEEKIDMEEDVIISYFTNSLQHEFL